MAPVVCPPQPAASRRGRATRAGCEQTPNRGLQIVVCNQDLGGSTASQGRAAFCAASRTSSV